MKEITEFTYPNLICENAKIDEKYAQTAHKMAAYLIDEFLKLCNIPHASGHVDKMREYLIDWGKSHNVDTFSDKSGCVFMDLPATSSCKNVPKVIFQSHFDMVAIGAKDNPDFDPVNSPIVPIFDKKNGIIHTGKKSTLGADDGYGVAASLAMILADLNPDLVFEHGPIRFIFTYDEETTQEGAENITLNHLDADYLINMDSMYVGEMVTSCSGGFYGTLQTVGNLAEITENSKLVKLEMFDLKGGHSGEDINKNRAHAVIILKDYLKELINNKINFNIKYIKSGDLMNAIPDKLSFEFVVGHKDAREAVKIWSSVMEKAQNQYIDGDCINFDIDVLDKTPAQALSVADSKRIYNLLKLIPIGPIEIFKNGVPKISNNIGMLLVDNNLLKAEILFRANDQETIRKAIKLNIKRSFDHDIDITIKAINSSWNKKEDNPLEKLFVEAFAKVANLKARTRDIHSGLEVGNFAKLNSNLHIISIGCDIVYEHNIKERLYTKSLPVFCATILYVLEHLKSN